MEVRTIDKQKILEVGNLGAYSHTRDGGLT